MQSTQALPLEILQAQVCSECSNFLTVSPITLFKDGQILCGRKDCLQENATPSLINKMLGSFQFPCVNYLDGCRKSLTYENSKIHENTCIFNPHECFFCSYKGNWAQILYHIRTEHPPNVTQVCRFSFEVGAESSRVLLYLGEDGDIYLVSVKISSEKFQVSITMPNVSDLKIKLTTIKFSLNPEINNQTDNWVEYNFFNSRSNNCFEKSIEELAFGFNLGTVLICHIAFDSLDLAHMELEFKKKDMWLNELMKNQAHTVFKKQKSLDNLNSILQLEKNNLEGIYMILKQLLPKVFCCRYCNEAINDNTVFFCANGHSYCTKCVPKTNTQCRNFDQKEGCMDFEKIEGLSKISLNCEWTHCNKSIPLPHYVDHKRTCSQRPFVCPVIKCFMKVNSSKALMDHWHSNVTLETNYPLTRNEYGVYNLFCLIDGDLYKVYVDFQESSIMVDIEAVNITFKMLKFEIDCKNKAGSKISFNKTNTRSTSGKQVFIAEGKSTNKQGYTNNYYGNGMSNVNVSNSEILNITPYLKQKKNT